MLIYFCFRTLIELDVVISKLIDDGIVFVTKSVNLFERHFAQFYLTSIYHTSITYSARSGITQPKCMPKCA